MTKICALSPPDDTSSLSKMVGFVISNFCQFKPFGKVQYEQDAPFCRHGNAVFITVGDPDMFIPYFGAKYPWPGQNGHIPMFQKKN